MKLAFLGGQSLPSTLLRGATAGVVATGAMSVTMWIAQKLGLMGTMPPRKITHAAFQALRPSAKRSSIEKGTAVLAHFLFGAVGGAIYSGVESLVPERRSKISDGLAWGLTIWATSYFGWVPAFEIMPSPKNDRPGRPTAMALSHMVYGATLAHVERRLLDRDWMPSSHATIASQGASFEFEPTASKKHRKEQMATTTENQPEDQSRGEKTAETRPEKKPGQTPYSPEPKWPGGGPKGEDE